MKTGQATALVPDDRDLHSPARRRADGVAEPLSLSFLARGVPVGFLWASDVVVLVASFLASYALFPLAQGLLGPGGAVGALIELLPVPGPEGGDLRPLGQLGLTLLVIVPGTLWAMDVLGGYREPLTQSRTRLVLVSMMAPVAGLSAFALVAFGFRIDRLSRTFFLTFGLLSVGLLLAYRSAIRRYKKERYAAGHYARNVLLVGQPAEVAELARFFGERVPPEAYRVAGCLRVPAGGTGSYVVPVMGDVAEAGRLLIHRPINDVVVAQGSGSDWLRDLLEQCDYFRVTVRIVPAALLEYRPRDLVGPAPSDGLGLPGTVLRPYESDSPATFVKRLVDIVVSAAALVALTPVFAAIAAAIKLTTPHMPVFYRWRVVGYKGREFVGYKFTTMVEDADDRKQQLMDQNEMSGPVFKIKNDPRVTPLGRFLRKFSLNELPQLWSVLKGDMSLVGPRPAFPHELARYEHWQKRKLSVRPGITCLWQVSGRNRISNFDDWVRLDLEYIDNWSLWLDFKILVRTVWAVAAGTGS